MDFNNTKNVIVASAMLVLGLGGAAISITSGDLSVTISGMSLAAIVGIILNLCLPNEKEEKETENTVEEKKITKRKNKIKENVGVDDPVDPKEDKLKRKKENNVGVAAHIDPQKKEPKKTPAKKQTTNKTTTKKDTTESKPKKTTTTNKTTTKNAAQTKTAETKTTKKTATSKK